MAQDEQAPEAASDGEEHEGEEPKELLDDLDPDDDEAEDVTGGKRVSGRWDARY